MSALRGKLAVVSGASRGIGAAVSCALAKEGAKLVLVSHPWHKEDLQRCAEEAKKCGAADVQCEVVDFADSQAVAKFADKTAGSNPSILVNNAGIFGSRSAEELGPLKGNPDDWEKMMKVNALAPMRLIRSIAPGMCQRGEGTIINITDVEAVHEGAHHAAYAASKHALRGFSASAYEALRSSGVKVVDIAPGNVEHTGMSDKSDKLGGQGSILPEDVAEAVKFVFHVSANCVPEEIVLKAARPGTA